VAKYRIGWDVETHPVIPGLLTPRLVCLTWATDTKKEILDRDGAIDFLRRALQDPEVELIAHRGVYDLAVCANEDPRLLPLIFAKIEAGQILDTMVRQQLIDIATGDFQYFTHEDKRVKNHHSLAQYMKRYFNRDIVKGKASWQLRFGELDGVPLSRWPEGAITYAMEDAVFAREIGDEQDALCGGPIPTENLQIRAFWSLHLMGCWGLRTHKERVIKARDQWVDERNDLERKLKQAGVMRLDGTRDVNLIRSMVKDAYEKMNKPVPYTESGKNICTDKEALADSNEPTLQMISKYVGVEKNLSTYLPVLMAASETPFNPSWHVLVRSGRTSCGGGEEDGEGVGQVQNLPRGGPIRACYIPREGYYYASTDLDTAELRSLGEVCTVLGFNSVLAEELNNGLDPHKSFAADLMSLTYEQFERAYKDGDKEAKNARQFAKIWNFGAPGFLGVDGLVSYAKGYGVILEKAQARRINNNWRRHYREMNRYFAHTKSVVARSSKAIHPITGFVRGDLTVTALSNHWFQHLTACAAKEALYEITKESYTGKSSDGKYDGSRTNRSPLFNSRPCSFVHDEVLSETPKLRAHDAAYRQAELMVVGANAYIKHVKNSCSPALMTAMYKDAKETFDENGKLIPWEP
jgi:DNA polymerase family A/3'-5' exonuclease